ncbi:MAG: hypothetical protein ACT4OO_11580 [Nitrospiraceae bacterium]
MLNEENERVRQASWWKKIWHSRVREKLGLTLTAILATVLLYAEGVLKSGWIEVVLVVPILWFFFTPRAPELLQNLLLSLVAICITISGIDLLLRPIFSHRLHYTPFNISSHKLPALPIVGRWDPHLDFNVESYGDLAALAGDANVREPRRIIFRTDGAGFRNVAEGGPIDVLVLGDSFGAGAGTTEEHIFSRLLETQHGCRTYNLSYPGGPYDQFINFSIESPRLHFSPQAKVIWTFYTGNDLDDTGGDIWDIQQLPWKKGFAAWLVTYRTFRNRSPLNQWMEALRLRFVGKTGDVVVRRDLPDGRPMLFQSNQEIWGVRSRHEVEQHPNFVKLQRTLQTMRTVVAEQGLDLAIFILPTKGEVYRWILDQRAFKPEDMQSSGFAQAVLGACEQADLKCFDTKPYLAEEARRVFESGKLLWWRDDTHMGQFGHEAVTAFIYRNGLTHNGSQAGADSTICNPVGLSLDSKRR